MFMIIELVTRRQTAFSKALLASLVAYLAGGFFVDFRLFYGKSGLLWVVLFAVTSAEQAGTGDEILL